MIDSVTVETMFAHERPRLVRLCARLSGNTAAAEDLAQETLLRAWQYLDRLAEANQAAPWLSGIARNVCLEWSRRYYREQRWLIQPTALADHDSRDAADQGVNQVDLEFELERTELVTLLDQALGLLPPETQAVLIQKYVEESSYVMCGCETTVGLGAYYGIGSDKHDRSEVRIVCQTCHWTTNYALESFALIVPEAQQFWRTYPRLCILPLCVIEVDNAPAFLMRLRSVISGAGLDIILLRNTCKVVAVHKVSS